jgi:hypothetical protein
MNPRDMTPDELEQFEEDVVQDAEDVVPDHGPASEPEVAKEIDRDSDGLPDTPAAYRVPS